MSSRTTCEQRTVDADLLAANVRVPQHVVFRAFPAETVVLNLHTGTYHGLNPSGGRMLEALERAPRVGAAAAALSEQFATAASVIERDLCELCEALLQRGLIEIDGDRRS